MHQQVENVQHSSKSCLSVLLLFNDLNFLIDVACVLRPEYQLTIAKDIEEADSLWSLDHFDAIIVDSLTLDLASDDQLSRFCRMREKAPTIELNAYHFHEEIIGAALKDIILSTLRRFYTKRSMRFSIP